MFNIFKKKKQIEPLIKETLGVGKTRKYLNSEIQFEEIHDEFLERITATLKDKYIYKTNIYCTHYDELLNNQTLSEKEDERFFNFTRKLRKNDYFQYYCILEKNDINNNGMAYIAIEPIAAEELENIVSECDVTLEKIENVAAFLNFPYWSIQEPRERRINAIINGGKNEK